MSLHPDYTTLLGYTSEELETYFGKYIEQVADYHQMSYQQTLQTIQRWYNGYSWDGANFVYNPFSTLQLFFQKNFSNYWFETGTPRFLVKRLQQEQITALDLESYKTRQGLLESSDITQLNSVGLLFQTGYLTIKAKDQRQVPASYQLGFPNEEVKQAMQYHFLAEYLGKSRENLKAVLMNRLEEALENQNIPRFIKVFQTVFAQIPYNLFIDEEAYYHTVVYLTVNLLGQAMQAEVQTNVGRIDAVLQYDQAVYVMEFKMGSAEEALQQIHTRKYYQTFENQGKDIYLLGVSFDEQEKNIGEWKLEKV